MAFDLWTEPWIPCTRPDQAQPRVASLRAVLDEAHEIDDIAVQSPVVTAALYRFLLAVLHRALQGPKDARTWRAWWRAGRFDRGALSRYRAQSQNRFDLFNPAFPFYQTGNLPARFAAKPALTLGHQHTAFGANYQKFGGGVNADSAISPAHAALLLLAHHPYALGGTLSREPGDPPGGKGGTLPKAAVVVVKGKTLFQTLMLNLVAYTYTEVDRPAWERGGAGRGERPLDGYVDLLTWQTRRICLLPPEATDQRMTVRHVQIGAGWDPPSIESFARLESMVAFRRAKPTKKNPRTDWYPLAVSEEHSVWRDLTSLLVATEQSQPPRNLSWISELAAAGYLDSGPVVLDVLGLVTFQYKILLWRRERLILPSTRMDDPALTSIGLALQKAEAGARTLTYRLRDVDGDTGAVADYWSSLEAPFQEWLARLGQNPDPLAEWEAVIHRYAWRTFYRRLRAAPISLLVKAKEEFHFGAALRVALKDEPTK